MAQNQAPIAGATNEYRSNGGEMIEGVRVVEQVLDATDQARLRHRMTLAQSILEIRSGNLAEAVKALEASLAAYPDSAVVLVQLAELCFRDDTPRAQKYLERAAKVDPEYYRLHLIQALVHQKTGSFDPMLDSLNKCLDLSPGQTVARKLRADYLQQRVDSPESLRKAIDDYEQLESALPQQALYWSFYIGRCYFNLKEYGKAQKFLEPVIGSPLGAQAAYLLGLCKQELGDYTEALDYLSRIKGNPMANENVARIALIQAEAATGELRINYKNRALEELTLLLKNPAYKARPDQYLIAGRLAFELGLPSAAIEHLEKYLDRAPKDLGAQSLLLKAHLIQADPEAQARVDDLFHNYMATLPATGTAEVRRDYIRYLVKMKSWDKVEGELSELEKQSVGGGEISYLKAQIAFGKGDYPEAILAASQALQSPQAARDQIEILIGRACLNQNSLSEAGQHFDSAIASASEPLKGLRCLEIGNYYHEKQLSKEKIRYWNRALDLHPNNQQLRYEIGLAYLRSGSAEQASPCLERVIKETQEPPLRSQAHTLLGYIAVVGGATDAAEKNYRSAISEWPANLPATRGLAHLLSEMEKYSEAREFFTRAAALDPEDATLNIQVGIVCDKLNDIEGAEQAAEAAIKADPNYGEAYNFLGYMYAERGIKLDKALELVGKAMELEPNNPNITDSMAWVYYQQGNYPKAVELLEKAVFLLTGEFVRGSSVIHEHLGDAYDKMGQREKAREMWKKAAEGDPKSSTATEKLKKSLGATGGN
jgi:tetratricopeptide (TPR) repeat protein